MATYDVTDEAIIDAKPERVYQALVDEMDGKTTWWLPHHSFTLLSSASSAEVGARIESKVASKFPVKYTTQTVEVHPGRWIRVEYVAGSLRGTAIWTFTPVDDSTRIACRWQTEPAGALRLLARFLPVAHSHSRVTVAGFENLAEFLAR